MNRLIGSTLVVLGYLYGVGFGGWEPHLLIWGAILLYWFVEHLIYWRKNTNTNRWMLILDILVAVVLLFVTAKLFG